MKKAPSSDELAARWRNGMLQADRERYHRAVRKLRKIADSLMITIPANFYRETSWKEGDHLELILDRHKGVIYIQFYSA